MSTLRTEPLQPKSNLEMAAFRTEQIQTRPNMNDARIEETKESVRPAFSIESILRSGLGGPCRGGPSTVESVCGGRSGGVGGIFGGSTSFSNAGVPEVKQEEEQQDDSEDDEVGTLLYFPLFDPTL